MTIKARLPMQSTIKMRILAWGCVLASTLLVAVGSAGASDYERSVLDWRADRLLKLKGESGYLNLRGLFWLKPGEVSFGAGTDNDLVFRGADADVIGRFDVDSTGVRMTVQNGVDVQSDGARVKALFLADDTTADPVSATHGSLSWSVIRRQDRFAVRLRDTENPALDAFPPLEYFNIDPDYRVLARLRPFDEPRVLKVGTVIEGLGWEPRSPGVVEFELNGERFTLEAYESGDRLFFVFGDRSNGRETYPAGRFLYAAWPDANGMTVLDFNLAYSPPCAFNDFSTCPVASPRNRLPVSIPAGELHNRDAYFD